MIRAVSASEPLEDPRGRQARQLKTVIVLTGAILVVEAAGGWMSGSLALLSDAGHLLTDLLALVLSLMAVRFAALPPNTEKTFGYHRLEILTALLNGSLLILVSGVLVWQAVRRFLHPAAIEGPVMFGVALVGLLANLAGLGILSGHAHNLNMRGARMHIVGDALSSVGVLLTAIVLAFTGWVRLDALVAGAIAIVIAFGAVRLVREAVDVLLEGAPAGLCLDDVGPAIAAIPGVVEVHDLHVWCITTGLPALSGHVRIAAGQVASNDEMLNRIKQVVHERFGIVHTTLQLESPAYQELGDFHP
jgi:cobalt-zinc-cadmium efflux system protein